MKLAIETFDTSMLTDEEIERLDDHMDGPHYELMRFLVILFDESRPLIVLSMFDELSDEDSGRPRWTQDLRQLEVRFHGHVLKCMSPDSPWFLWYSDRLSEQGDKEKAEAMFETAKQVEDAHDVSLNYTMGGEGFDASDAQVIVDRLNAINTMKRSK